MPTPDLPQSAVVALVVLAAAAYLGRSLWSTISAARRAKAGDCATGCGCSAASREQGAGK